MDNKVVSVSEKISISDPTPFTSKEEDTDEGSVCWPEPMLDHPKCAAGKLPSILDGELFAVTENRGGHILAQCKVCEAKKIVKGSKNSTGNFISHIKRMHPEKRKIIEAKRLLTRDNSRKLHLVGLSQPHQNLHSDIDDGATNQIPDQEKSEISIFEPTLKKLPLANHGATARDTLQRSMEHVVNVREENRNNANEDSSIIFGRYIGFEIRNIVRQGFDEIADELKLQIHSSINKVKQELRERRQTSAAP